MEDLNLKHIEDVLKNANVLDVDGFKVYLRKIGGTDGIEQEGFGEDIDEAIYNALPMDIKGLDIKDVREVRA